MHDPTYLSITTMRPERFGRRRSRIRRILVVLFLLVIVILGVLRYIGVFGGNVHAVVPGRVYRSAELTGENLRIVLETDHIRTEINLRGGSPKDAWYNSELAECKRLKVRHVDIPMSASHFPRPRQLQELLANFDRDPYPVLFHCQGGADRSGLVGTLYLTIYQRVPLNQAEASQLTWRYGHVSFGVAHAMDDFFSLYRAHHEGLDLRTWILKRYPALYAGLPIAQKTLPEDPRSPIPTSSER